MSAPSKPMHRRTALVPRRHQAAELERRLASLRAAARREQLRQGAR